MASGSAAIAMLAARAQPLRGEDNDFDGLLARIGDARFVLIGEASHGTSEFYRLRAEITRRLVAARGFTAIAVEADWPDAYRVDRWVRGRGDDPDGRAALGSFERFPRWMWRNREVLAFVEWLRAHNAATGVPCGFYGLDLYSLHASIDAVLRYLAATDAPAALRARERYACFDHFGGDAQWYGHATGLGLAPSCEDAVVAQLAELSAGSSRSLVRHGDREARFFAEQNARLVRDAEAYYRAMFAGRAASWNLRDSHMADTLAAIERHVGGTAARIVVWAHNSHLGDARATQMHASGEHNLGQLARERWGEAVYSIGFSTYNGSVAAASDWDGPFERKRVRDALAGSCEHVLHQIGLPRFWLDLRDPAVAQRLREPRLQRAIGVIYRPETERQSHYFQAELPRQFDAMVHVDATHAVAPLDGDAGRHTKDADETWPEGL
jgi:erythromycin esterase-like protein